MSTLLKDIYSENFYNDFASILKGVIADFNKKKFISAIFAEGWEEKELKQRMRHTTITLHEFLPEDFEKAAKDIDAILKKLFNSEKRLSSLACMFLPEYIELYGINHYKTSVKLFELTTPFTSCEFAVRPFIIKYPEQMMDQMFQWSRHENHHVRRLASEGSRPRLPWAIALPHLKKNPEPVFPILENLKNDTSEYVRRSVANNLNDISKDHPDQLVKIAKKWKGLSKETDAIIKHASRTMLKQGHPDILEHFGLGQYERVEVSDFKILNSKVEIGDHLEFSFLLKNDDENSKLLRLEYGIYYLLKNGKQSKKVFKISERVIHAGDHVKITRRQSFKPITTKVFYKGDHQVSIIINGKEKIIEGFKLL